MAEYHQRENYQDVSIFLQRKEWLGNKGEVTLVWLTRTPLSPENSDGGTTLQGLRKISSYVADFYEPSHCREYMANTKDERIFLIVDGKLFADISEFTRSCHAVDSIYIFCIQHEKYVTSRNNSKVKGIFMNQSSLFKALQNGIEAVEKQILAFSRLNNEKHVLTKDLSRESASFFWFTLLFEVLETMPSATNDERIAMLNICRHYYRDNDRFLRDIEDFCQTYTAEKALKWYTKPSFVYKLVNKALRVEDVELLYQFRFYIIDLCIQLEQKWHLAKSEHPLGTSLLVFRGGKLTSSEFDLLTPGHLITTNGFLSTTYKIDVARAFVRNSARDSLNHHAVLFHITIPKTLTTVIFADVSRDAQIRDEDEVLFSLGARFHIDRVYADAENIDHIEMTATDDGCDDVDAYREVLQRHLKESKPIFVFGRLLLDMDQREKSKTYFQLLLQTISIDNHLDRAHTYAYLGRIARESGHFHDALLYHSTALQICNQCAQPICTLRASLLNSLGLDYCTISDFRNAFYHLYLSLAIKTILFGNNGHTHIARVSGHLAIVFQKCRDWKLALTFLRRALFIEQRFLPSKHIYIAFRFENLASLYVCQKNYALALVYYLQALAIVKRTLPVCHQKYILICNGISNVLTHLME